MIYTIQVYSTTTGDLLRTVEQDNASFTYTEEMRIEDGAPDMDVTFSVSSGEVIAPPLETTIPESPPLTPPPGTLEITRPNGVYVNSDGDAYKRPDTEYYYLSPSAPPPTTPPPPPTTPPPEAPPPTETNPPDVPPPTITPDSPEATPPETLPVPAPTPTPTVPSPTPTEGPPETGPPDEPPPTETPPSPPNTPTA